MFAVTSKKHKTESNASKKLAVSKYLNAEFLAWEARLGERQTLTGWAKHLGIEQAVLNKYVRGVRLPTGENVNRLAEKFSPNVLSIYLVDAEGYVYQAELGAREGQLDLVELGAGEKTKGWAAYSIPEGAVPAYVVFRPNVFAGVALRALVP